MDTDIDMDIDIDITKQEKTSFERMYNWYHRNWVINTQSLDDYQLSNFITSH